MCISAASAAILSLLSTGVAVAGQVQQAKTQSGIAKFNADTAKFQAEDAMKEGSILEERQLSRTRQIRAQQEAIMGAGGVDPTTGTAAQVLDQTTEMGTIDALTLRSNAVRRAWGYNVQASNDIFGGELAKANSNSAIGSTLLTGGARAYGIYRGR